MIITSEKAVSDGPELLHCVLLGLDSRLLLGGGGGGGGHAVELVVHDVEVWLWFIHFHILLPKNNVTAKRRLI